MYYKKGIPVIKSIEELDAFRKTNDMHIFVYAVYPKCNDDCLSLIPNAEKVLTKGCLPCNNYNWEPDIAIITK